MSSDENLLNQIICRVMTSKYMYAVN